MDRSVRCHPAAGPAGSKTFTGNFCIDDLVLHEAGVTDFSQYANVPYGELMPDFFVPDDTPVPDEVKNS